MLTAIAILGLLNGVFARCATEWEGFGVVMETLLDAGDHVVASGRYPGTWPASGRATRPQVAHIWCMADRKALAFQQHIDALGVA